MSQDGLSPVERNLVRLATPLENYGTVAEAIEAVADARGYQIEVWPAVLKMDAGGRSPEEWQLLLNHYVTKLNAVYSESDGAKPEGRARYAKYAAIVANISFWLVQSTIGPVNDDKRIAAGIKAIGAVFTGNGGTAVIEDPSARSMHPVMDESGFSSGAGFAAATN